MKFKTILTVMIPSTFSWMLAALLLLIYSFDILEYVNSSPNNPFAGLGVLLLGIILTLVILAMYFTGHILDTYPEYLRLATLIGMFGSSFSIIIFALTPDESFLLIVSLMTLSFFFAILLTSSGTLFAGLTDMWKRGRTYSYGMALFIILTLISIILGGFISHSFPDTELFSHSWAVILPLTGLQGFILGILFFIFTRDMGVPWINDRWPTKFDKIIGRRSVRAYLVTHILLYTMVGIAITAFSKLGGTFNVDLGVTIPNIGRFELPPDKTFWFIVLVGDLLAVVPAGYFADKIGRKNLIVLTIYGIVFSTLIFGLEQESFGSYLTSALVLGFSFALLHPTLDSSLWADLSPRDGLGRYYALGFISLALGLGVGSGIGQWILVPTQSNIEFLTYLLIILAILAAFPLFWVSDSYEPLDFNLLLVMEEGGLPIFDYMFQKKIEFSVELTLLSGALTAVASFMSETMKEKGDLNLVQHGKHFILTEKKGGVSAAIFSNKQDPELQRALKEFLDKFCQEYSETLKTWNGTRSLFDGAVDIAEEVFGHLAPSTDL
ncbi:MAG: MFS transporter [Candidatus Hodarchaeales archaeon]